MHSSIHYLIVPGWNNSDPTHWQSRWQAFLPNAARVEQENWAEPTLESWVSRLQAAVSAAKCPIVLVAHSLGCVTVAHWAGQHPTHKIRGALLVAPADVERPNAPLCLQGFAPIPRDALPFRAHVVASDNDPFCRAFRALDFASHWQADYTLMKNAGHINADTTLGLWEEGLIYLDRLTENDVRWDTGVHAK